MLLVFKIVESLHCILRNNENGRVGKRKAKVIFEIYGATDWQANTQLVFACSKSTIETVEKDVNYVQRRQGHVSHVFIVDSEHISHLFVVILLFTLSR